MSEHELKVAQGHTVNLARQPAQLDQEDKKRAATQAAAVQRSPLNPIMRHQSYAKAHASALQRPKNSEAASRPAALLHLQRNLGNCYVQRVVSLARESADAEPGQDVEDAIQRKRGTGQPLDSGVRGQMESSFQTDFSKVRVHHDADADTLNQAVGASAFATGKDIFFRQGAYNPGTSGGRELLAHELTHVVQQTGSSIHRKLAISEPGDAMEREADQVAKSVIQAEHHSEQAEKSQLQRQSDALSEEEEEKKKNASI